MPVLILRRLAAMFAVLLVLTAVIFLLRQLTPANPARVALGPQASIGAVEEYSRELGLDRPLVVQYFTYLNDVVHGDFQVSVRTRRAVSEDLAKFVPATLELALYGIIFAAAGGLLLGVLSAAAMARIWSHPQRDDAGGLGACVPPCLCLHPDLLQTFRLASEHGQIESGRHAVRSDAPAHR